MGAFLSIIVEDIKEGIDFEITFLTSVDEKDESQYLE